MLKDWSFGVKRLQNLIINKEIYEVLRIRFHVKGKQMGFVFVSMCMFCNKR